MIIRWLCLLLFVLAAPIVPTTLGQGAYPPRSDTFINDYAELLTAADAADVQLLLSDLQASRGVEAVVVTINSVADYDTGDATIESFATGLFNSWGIGDATKNDGVLLLVAVKDRKVRVELGAGYGSGPSGEMQAVIDRYVLPKFRESHYSGGIRLGTQAMIAKLTDQPLPEIGDIPPTRAPFASTGSGATSARDADSSLGGLLLVAVMAFAVFALIRQAVNGSESGGWSSDQDTGDDDNGWRRTDSNRRSSWTSSSRRSSSHSSTSRSSSSSRRGGGKSGGGGASGSW